jgi:hypothetical protein
VLEICLVCTGGAEKFGRFHPPSHLDSGLADLWYKHPHETEWECHPCRLPPLRSAAQQQEPLPATWLYRIPCGFAANWRPAGRNSISPTPVVGLNNLPSPTPRKSAAGTPGAHSLACCAFPPRESSQKPGPSPQVLPTESFPEDLSHCSVCPLITIAEPLPSD